MNLKKLSIFSLIFFGCASSFPPPSMSTTKIEVEKQVEEIKEIKEIKEVTSLLNVKLCKYKNDVPTCSNIIRKVMKEDSWARFTLVNDQIDHCKARFRTVEVKDENGNMIKNFIRNISCYDKDLQNLFSTVAVTPENKCAVLRFERTKKDVSELSQFVIILCEEGAITNDEINN